MQERRRYPRYGIQIPVDLRAGVAFHTLQTHDVSLRGLFVCTETPPRPSQLVEVRLRLPPEDQLFRAHAMCTFALRPGSNPGHPAGAGLRFYAMADEERRKWEGFVRLLQRQVRAGASGKAGQAATAPAADLAAPPADRGPGSPSTGAEAAMGRAKPAPLQFRPDSLDELLHFSSTDLEKGAGFVHTGEHAAPGGSLCLRVVHPETGGTFDLACVVDRAGRDHRGAAGVAIVFSDLDEALREDFRRFVYLGFTEIELTDVLTVEAPGSD